MCENKTVTNVANVGETKVEFLTRKIDLVVEGEHRFNLKAEGYGEDFLLQLVSKLKNAYDVDSKVVAKPSVLVPTEILDPKHNEVSATTLEATYEAPKPVYKTATEPGTAISDKFGEKSKEMYAVAGVTQTVGEHDYFHTGIKYDDSNRPKYRCAYECPKCGANGRHYIPFHIPRVSCHQCNTPLVVEPATEKGKGTTDEHRDENGNFLFAEVIDYTVAKFDKSGKF